MAQSSKELDSTPSLARSAILSKLGTYLWRVKASFAASAMLLIFIAGLTAAKAWIIQPVFDRFLAGGASRRELWLFILLVASIFLLQGVAEWLYAIFARVASARVIRDVRQELFRHLTLQNLGYFSERPSSDLASRVVNDVQVFENAGVSSVQTLLKDLLTVVFLLVVLLVKDWRVALTCIAIVGISGVVLRVMSGKIERITLSVRRMVSQIQRQLTEMIGGIELIVGFGLGTAWQRRFGEVNAELYREQLRTTRTSASAVLLVKVIVTLGVCGVILVTGTALREGRISEGEFVTFLAVMYLLQAPATAVGNSVAKLSRAMAAAGRAFAVFEDAPSVVDPDRPERLPDRGLDIEFDRVGFLYKAATPVLSELSFAVSAGQLVAMVGDSGAGKSTVAKLLMRFYDPDDGEIRLGGVPLPRIERRELYRHVAYVSQDVYLFDGTIDFNLRVGRPDATAAELEEAVRIACLDHLVAELEHGLDTEVGERGARLSGGQRQRIAIARAVLTEARTLILDEATSALDMDLEQRILQNLVEVGRTRTIFAVTHRLSLADIADRVVVLRNGRLAEDGTAEELARRDGEFARLQRASEARLVRPAPTVV